MPAVGRFWYIRFWLNCTETQCFHDLRDFSDATVVSQVFQLISNPSSTVTATVLLKDDSYQRREFGVLFFGNCRLRVQPCIECRSIHRQEFAGLRNPEHLLCSNRLNGCVDISYSLRPKIANAFFKMSRSRSTLRSSFSSSRTRASSELATGPLRCSRSCFHR